jgi:hypothetical protein
MSTSNSAGRLTATLKKDRSRLCAFTFADGRQCRMSRRSGHQHLCYYHAKKEADALIAEQAGEDLASLFCGKVLRVPDFAAALGRVLSAVARGHIKPKTAVSLALLGHTLNQSIKIAQNEYANAAGGNARRERVVSILVLSVPPKPPSQVAPTPQPEHSAASGPNPQSPRQPVPAQVPKPFRINTCAERLIITPVTTLRINTSRSVDSKAT